MESQAEYSKENTLKGWKLKFGWLFKWIKYIRVQFTWSEVETSQWADVANKTWSIPRPTPKGILFSLKLPFGRKFSILLKIGQ